MSTPARLWLIRHGETDWNRQGRVQGHTPTHLNAHGRQQAETLARILAARNAQGQKFHAIYSSDLPRAFETAQPIAAALQLSIEQTAELRERSFGQYEGATNAEIQASRAALGLAPNNDMADWTGMPGIESNATLWERISTVLRRIAATHAGEDVLIVTHGGVLSRAMFETLQIPDGSARRFPLSNSLVAILQWREPIHAFYLLSLADLPLITGISPPEPDTATVK